MLLNWALFPLVIQAVYTAAALPPLLRLHAAKVSDQHAIANHVLVLGAHGAMIAWAASVGQAGLIASYLVGILITLTTLGMILHYRVFPGGRPATPPLPSAWRASERTAFAAWPRAL